MQEYRGNTWIASWDGRVGRDGRVPSNLFTSSEAPARLCAVMPAAVFDQFAHDYDEHFGGILGRLFRRAVWRWLDSAFQAGEQILELSCGTGEDALHLAGQGVRILATDPSAGMLEVARKKILAEGGSEQIQLRQLAIE